MFRSFPLCPLTKRVKILGQPLKVVCAGPLNTMSPFPSRMASAFLLVDKKSRVVHLQQKGVRISPIVAIS
jgi:hypothetical protein